MDFVIQCNMLREQQLQAIREAVQGLPHRFVGLIPFSREITSDEPLEGLDHIPWGSTSFVEEALRRGWRGLSFDPMLFRYDVARDNRDDMLNDSIIGPAGAIVAFLKEMYGGEEIFLRPAHDLKQFSGAVYSTHEAVEFLEDALSCTSSGSYKIEKDLLLVAALPRKILYEWRSFIVDGKIIDCSSYRRFGELFKEHIEDKENLELLQQQADKWLPAACCVMDTCLLADGTAKVVEFNCINGSGFYDHDIKKIMHAWHEYHAQRP